ncbi:MAG: tryptophan-rich sensory protein [Ruminiclostridium sp.]|nr:tryptophan-rich sensory protein [Ruminiclostridium sp.]
MKKHNIADMLIFIISAELIGALSALLSGGFSDFFTKYEEPPLLPPAWLFPVVWVILYAVMGFSAYIIYSSDENAIRKKALTVYWTQLAVNFMWSIVFFRFEALWAAFAVIIVLLVLIAVMINRFRKINAKAAYLNVPYLLWVAFASYLNFATAIINN